MKRNIILAAIIGTLASYLPIWQWDGQQVVGALGLGVISFVGLLWSEEVSQKMAIYKIMYAGGRCQSYAHGRADLLEWLNLLKDETITDIRKETKGKSQSVMDRDYIKKALTPASK